MKEPFGHQDADHEKHDADDCAIVEHVPAGSAPIGDADMLSATVHYALASEFDELAICDASSLAGTTAIGYDMPSDPFAKEPCAPCNAPFPSKVSHGTGGYESDAAKSKSHNDDMYDKKRPRTPSLSPEEIDDTRHSPKDSPPTDGRAQRSRAKRARMQRMNALALGWMRDLRYHIEANAVTVLRWVEIIIAEGYGLDLSDIPTDTSKYHIPYNASVRLYNHGIVCELDRGYESMIVKVAGAYEARHCPINIDLYHEDMLHILVTLLEECTVQLGREFETSKMLMRRTKNAM